MAPPSEDEHDLDHVFRTQRRPLWILCYQLTGSGAEADDMVQEAFVQTIERPPPDLTRGYGPWLVRAATRLSLNELRERRGREYGGEWLPAPADTEDGVGFQPGVDTGAGPQEIRGARYDLDESTSFPFLIALEKLEPMERGALILRDVLAFSPGAAADALDENEATVERLHQKAREAMEGYDEERRPLDDTLRSETRAVLERFLDSLARGDAKSLESLLAENVRAVCDSGGSYLAPAAPIVGRAAVARAQLREAEIRSGAGEHVEIRLVNAMPAALLQVERPKENHAPRGVLRFDLDAAGRIRRLHTILAPSKLASVRFARDI